MVEIIVLKPRKVKFLLRVWVENWWADRCICWPIDLILWKFEIYFCRHIFQCAAPRFLPKCDIFALHRYVGVIGKYKAKNYFLLKLAENDLRARKIISWKYQKNIVFLFHFAAGLNMAKKEKLVKTCFRPFRCRRQTGTQKWFCFETFSIWSQSVWDHFLKVSKENHFSFSLCTRPQHGRSDKMIHCCPNVMFSLCIAMLVSSAKFERKINFFWNFYEMIVPQLQSFPESFKPNAFFFCTLQTRLRCPLRKKA